MTATTEQNEQAVFDAALTAAQQLPHEAHAHFLALIAPPIDFYVSCATTFDLASALGELPPAENETMMRWSLALLEGDIMVQFALETWLQADLCISADTIKAARAIVVFAFEHRPPPKRERRIPTQPILIRKGHPTL